MANVKKKANTVLIGALATLMIEVASTGSIPAAKSAGASILIVSIELLGLLPHLGLACCTRVACGAYCSRVE